MRKYLFWLLIIFLTLSLPAAVVGQTGAAPPKVGLLIDGSKSMEGFFIAREADNSVVIDKLHRQITTANRGADYQGSDSLFLSASTRKPYRANFSPANLGEKTFIDKAYDSFLSDHSDLDIIWLVTDNIQDPDENEQNNKEAVLIKKFYKNLGDDKVKEVYVIPQKRNYRGRLWKEDGMTPLTENYDNQRGLVVYALLFNNKRKSFFEQSVKKFARAVKFFRGNGIHVKPLKFNPDSIAADIIPDPDARPRYRLKPQNGKLTASGTFKENQPIKGSFLIRFKSDDKKNIAITNPRVDVVPGNNFKLTDFTILDQAVTTIAPPNIRGNLEPGHISKGVVVRIAFPRGVKLNRSLPVLWRAGFKRGNGNFAGKIHTSLTVTPKKDFKIAADVLADYSTNDFEAMFHNPEAPPDIHQKIYALDAIIPSIYPQNSDLDAPGEKIITGNYDIAFKVKYPAWPVVVPIGLFLLLVLIALAIYYGLSWSPVYSLKQTGHTYYFKRRRTKATGAAHDDIPDIQGLGDSPRSASDNQLIKLPWLRKKPITQDGTEVLALKHGFFNRLTALAASGYLIDGRRRIILDKNGTNFIVEPDDSAKNVKSGNKTSLPPTDRQLDPDSIYKK